VGTLILAIVETAVSLDGRGSTAETDDGTD